MTARPASQNPAPAPAAPEAATTARRDGAGYTLQECIDLWHANHPGFQMSVEGIAPITQVWRTPPSGNMIRAAAQIDVSPADYRAHIEAGERWCSHCRMFHDATTVFAVNTSVCKRYWSDYRQALKERAS